MPTRSRKSASTRKMKKSRRSRQSHGDIKKASDSMSLFDLQKIARSKGIPFGGLRKSQLIRKINIY